MNLSRFLRKGKSFADFVNGRAKISYSQFGEDIIIDYIFSVVVGKNNPSYLDIGANDPVLGNNSYLFYRKNCFGLCVEPDPILYERIIAKRPKGKNLQAGIGINDNRTGTLYVFPRNYTGWNTFSKKEADLKATESGIIYKEISDIPLIPVNDVMDKYFGSSPDFISIDVEGLDFEILKTINFDKFKPIVFCVETALFDIKHKGKKNNEIIDFMFSSGYKIYADKFINTIFIRKDILG